MEEKENNKKENNKKENPSGKPFAFLSLIRGQLAGIFQKEKEAVNLCISKTEYPSEALVVACFKDNKQGPIDMKKFQTRMPISTKEAEAWVKKRMKATQEAKDKGLPGAIVASLGSDRASVEDPEEKQAQDYIKSAPLVWKKPA